MQIRDFSSHADRAACVALQEITWGTGFTEKIPAAMLLVAQETGGVTAGAFDDDGRLLGFVFGVTGLRNGALVHWSDMLAVHPDAQGQHLGEALKEYQRERCVELGVGVIYWTYDPLVARNAHLNMNRLGAHPEEYIIAMYGEATNSPLQGDMPTDRFIIAWPVDPSGRRTPVVTLPDGLPIVVQDPRVEQPLIDAPQVGIRVPRDITALFAADPATARAWRTATRRAFTHYLPAGWFVRGFVADAEGGTYLLERTT